MKPFLLSRARAACVALAVMATMLLLASSARADIRTRMGGNTGEKPPELEGIDIDEHLGSPLPLDATFKDTSGNVVHLGDYFDHKRPVAFVFAYHTCPMLCSLVLDAVVRGLEEVPWTVGKEFDVVSISIDPSDSPASATKKRDQLVAKYGRGTPASAWHFLTGDEANIRKVTNAIGFEYRYDAAQKQFAHPAAMYLLTPDGKIARYLYGIEFKPSDIRLALLEASEGRSISTTEKLILYCFHYDPQGKKYSIVALNVMRLGGGVTIVLLGGFLAVMWTRERRKRRAFEQSESAKTKSTSVSTPQHATKAATPHTP